jgi:hypothetical protein
MEPRTIQREIDSGPKVFFRSGPLRGQVLSLERDRTSFGRDPRNHVAIHDDIISSFHAAIIKDGESFFLEDGGSKNGTFVNGDRITRVELKDGDVFCLCQSGPELVFTRGKPSLPTAIESSTATFARTRSLLLALKELLPGRKKDTAGLLTLTGVRRLLDFELEASAHRTRVMFLWCIAAFVVICLGGFFAAAHLFRGAPGEVGVSASPGLPPLGTEVALDLRLDPIYGSLFLSYRETPIGEVTIANQGTEPIPGGELRFRFEGEASSLLGEPWILRVDELAPGESRKVPLRPKLANQVLSTHAREATATLTFTVSGRQPLEASRLVFIHPRDVFSWARPDRIAAFVDPHDPAVAELVRAVWDLRPMVSRDECPPPRLVGAFTLLTALVSLDLRYLPDATHPISQRVDSGANDSVKFPGETILGRAGDCDDLAVLGCSLLEAAGIPTAFAVGTGHVFFLFDVDLPADSLGESPFDPESVLAWRGRVWLPIEATELARPGASVAAAWAAAWRFVKPLAAGELTIVELAEAWGAYQPMNPPPDEPTRARIAELRRVREALPGRLESALQSLRRLFRDNLTRRVEQISSEMPAGLEREQAIGLLYARSGLFQEARGIFERAVFGAAQPGGAQALREWGKQATEDAAVLLVHLALCLSLGGHSSSDFDLSALYGELAVERLPSLSPFERGELMLRVALVHRLRGDLPAERAWSQKAFAADPSLEAAYQRLISSGGPVAGPAEEVRDYLRLGLVRRRGR